MNLREQCKIMNLSVVITLLITVETCFCLGYYVQEEIDNAYCGDVPTTCEDKKYRNFDGSCNNLKHPWWGTAHVPYKRLPCGELITLDDEDFLPNVRKISTQSYVDIKENDKLWTLLFMQYGQAIAHDISETEGVPQTPKRNITCCTNGTLTEEAWTNPQCRPVLVPRDDPVYAPENITCIDFIRVLTTNDVKCTNPPRTPQPLNAVPAALDLSFVYGRDEQMSRQIREFKRGRLKTLTRNGIQVLPQDPDSLKTCRATSKTEPCYLAGDDRVNQNPQLAVVHTILARHHNFIAEMLAQVNPHWDEETLFQETRRVMIAWHQQIVYNEYLEGAIGTDYAVAHNLTFPNATGFIEDYDENINLGAYNEYATSAFRVFHDEIQGLIRSMKENRNTTNLIALSDWFNKPSVCEHGNNFKGLTIGLVTQPSRARKRYITKDVQYELFKQGPLGQDLRTIDLQRARDQGLCSYADMLRHAQLANPKSFNDIKQFMDVGNIRILKQLYGYVRRVELAAAMFLERRQPRSLSSPLGQFINGIQFRNLRRGDRYFYERGTGKGAFTLDQLNEIRRVGTIANMFCTSGDVQQMQPQAFKRVSEQNPLKDCRSYPTFNPLPWKERQ